MGGREATVGKKIGESLLKTIDPLVLNLLRPLHFVSSHTDYKILIISLAIRLHFKLDSSFGAIREQSLLN